MRSHRSVHADRLTPAAEWPADAFARVCDYLLDGVAHMGADRMVGDRLREIAPWVERYLRLGRRFTGHALTVMTRQGGLDQFLDLGSGSPTAGNTHQLLAAIAPAARVVYVDIAPLTVATGRMLLENTPRAAMLGADLRDVDHVVKKANATGLLDLTRPVGVVMDEVAHHLPDPLHAVPAAYLARLAPGSMLALTHRTFDAVGTSDPAIVADIQRLSGLPNIARTFLDISALLSGVALMPPGLAPVVEHLIGGEDDSAGPRPWMPTTGDDVEHALLGAIGRLRPDDARGLSPPTPFSR